MKADHSRVIKKLKDDLDELFNKSELINLDIESANKCIARSNTQLDILVEDAKSIQSAIDWFTGIQ